MDSIQIIKTTKNLILNIRKQNVIIDSDLAKIYKVETKRINEQVKRNINKFPPDFMFQLTKEEFSNLKSQNATSSWGGRRTLPYAFTEHGILQVANILKSELANQVSVFVIRAFIEMRNLITSQEELMPNSNNKINKFFLDIKPKLYGAVNQILETVIDSEKGTTIKQEAQDILNESINSLKERLKKTGLENEEIAARITKILSEAEKERALARKTNAETDRIEFITTIKKLRLILEAQKILIGENNEDMKQINNFISILESL